MCCGMSAGISENLAISAMVTYYGFLVMVDARERQLGQVLTLQHLTTAPIVGAPSASPLMRGAVEARYLVLGLSSS
jgi:hypothetical protein